MAIFGALGSRQLGVVMPCVYCTPGRSGIIVGNEDVDALRVSYAGGIFIDGAPNRFGGQSLKLRAFGAFVEGYGFPPHLRRRC